jgi:hypothetical protein
MKGRVIEAPKIKAGYSNPERRSFYLSAGNEERVKGRVERV